MVVTTGSKNIEARKKLKRDQLAGKTTPAPAPKAKINMSPGFAKKHEEAQRQLKAGTIPSDKKATSPTAEPEKKKSFWQKTGDKIRDTSVGKWLEEKGVLASGEEQATAEEGMLERQAEFKEKSVGEKAKAFAGDALLAAGAGGSLDYAVASTFGKLNNYLATKGIQIYGKTAQGLKYNVPVQVINQKTTRIAKNIASKVFSPRFIASALIGGEATSLVLGLWSGTEAPEPITLLGFRLEKAILNATPEDLPELEAQYEEWKEIVTEFTNPSTIDKILTFSPVGVIHNILKKMKGIKKGAELGIKLTDNLLESKKTGEDIYAMGRREKEEADVRSVNYFNEQAEIRQNEKIEIDKIANKAEREAASKFWQEHEKTMQKLEEEERQRVADFWVAYREAALKAREGEGKSTLGFGMF